MLYKKYYCTDIEKKELKKVIDHAVFKRLGSGYHSAFHIYMLCVTCFIFTDNVVFQYNSEHAVCILMCIPLASSSFIIPRSNPVQFGIPQSLKKIDRL